MKGILLITGGSRGIGAATAILTARAGYHVVFTYRTNAEKAQQLVDKIELGGGKALAYACDAGSEKDILHLFDALDQLEGPLVGLVNNAGILKPRERFESMSLQRWQEVFSINLFGSMLCMREAIRRMSTRHGGPGGSIVNVSSAAARLGGAHEFTDYAASKGAMDTLTIGLAQEVATEGIRINGVRPGLIFTDIHADSGQPDRVEDLAHGVPMQRGGTPEEVAESILWLLSDKASYVTGAILDVTGGR